MLLSVSQSQYVTVLPGLLNPLACPHHLSVDDDSPYRETAVLDKPVRDGRGSYVNAGLRQDVQIDKQIQPGVRVTVRMSHRGEGGSCYSPGSV